MMFCSKYQFFHPCGLCCFNPLLYIQLTGVEQAQRGGKRHVTVVVDVEIVIRGSEEIESEPDADEASGQVVIRRQVSCRVEKANLCRCGRRQCQGQSDRQ